MMRKITMSLPDTFVEDLDVISTRIGISRSSLVANLTAEPVSDLRALLDAIPENPTQEDLIRFRGKSAETIKARLDDLKKLEEGDDLFTQ